MRNSFLIAAAFCSAFFLGSCAKKKAPGTESQNNSAGTVLYSEFHDFQSVADGRIDSTKGSSDKMCGVVNDKVEYSFGLDKQLKQIPSFKSMEDVNISFSCLMDKAYPDDVFVLSIDDTVAKKNVMWEGKGITPAKFGEWSPVTISYKINRDFLNPEYILKLYIWNKGKNTFYFDDLSFSFLQKKK
jgi:hypothetical protein